MRAAVAFRNEAKVGPYELALREVGIEPVRISPQAPSGSTSFGGLLLTGGTDVNPSRYGQEHAPETQAPDDERDGFETGLLEHALAAGVPVLAICRGMQLFNVVHGGTLIQHLPDGGVHQVKQKDAVAHSVRVAPGTRLASIVGAGEHEVNSRHHQAVDCLGDGLIVSAVSPDGVIEAIEKLGEAFAVAVQWHPEDRILVSATDRKLFEAFAAAIAAHTLEPAPNRSSMTA
jgi:putative glutamine amidotransferase